MDGIEVIERIYNHVSAAGIKGWMDKKPIRENPESYFIISHINTNHSQFTNRIPINVNVYTTKTESGLPKRDLLRSILSDIQVLFDGVAIDEVYFSASKTFTAFLLNSSDYDVLTARYDVIVSR